MTTVSGFVLLALLKIVVHYRQTSRTFEFRWEAGRSQPIENAVYISYSHMLNATVDREKVEWPSDLSGCCLFRQR